MFGDGKAGYWRKAAAVLGFGAIVAGATQLPELPKYSRDFDLKATLDKVVATSTAQIYGNFAGLEARGNTLTEGQADVRDRITARYEEIKGAEQNSRRLRGLDWAYRDGYSSASKGYLTAQEVAERGNYVLAADDYMKDYAAGAQSRLEGQGLDAKASQSIVAGMIGTELIRLGSLRDSPEEFISRASYSDEIKSDLMQDIPTIRQTVKMVTDSSNANFSKVWSRGLDAMWNKDGMSGAREAEDRVAVVQAKAQHLVTQRGETRPAARPEIEARSDRIRERALAIAKSKRPVARTDRDDMEM